MVSRATIHNRRLSEAYLNGYAQTLDLPVPRAHYDDQRRRFVLTSEGVELIAGRYEVITAFLRGYLAGRQACPLSATSL